MRLVFVGAVEGSYRALEALLEAEAEVVKIFTLDLKYSGRHSDFADLRPLAARFRVPLSGINNINQAEVVEDIKACNPDYILVIGWSQILKKPLLGIPDQGVIGFHPALLPKNRGRAALPWLILQGEQEGGATLFYVDEGMDTGDIICQHRFEVAQNETARTLYNKVVGALVTMIEEITPGLRSGLLPHIPQDHSKATYTAKRTWKDGLIDWRQSACQIWTLIRAVSEPYPGAFTFYKGQRLTILEADLIEKANYVGIPGQVLRHENGGVLVQCSDGHIRISAVQEEGKTKMLAPKYFSRVHDLLGIDWLDLYEKMKKDMIR